VLARDAILHVDHQLKRNGLRYKRVFFLSPDILIDQHGQATMVEVNVNGYMIGNLHKSFFPLHEEQRAVFRLMGGNGFPKQHKYAQKGKVHAGGRARDLGDGARGHALRHGVVPPLPPSRRLRALPRAERLGALRSQVPHLPDGGGPASHRPPQGLAQLPALLHLPRRRSTGSRSSAPPAASPTVTSLSCRGHV
jgi:hypothetical protein